MGIQHQVLGEPGRDNALLLRASTGQSTCRLLFDCGEGCLSGLSAAEIRSINALFFSHLHIDHVAGFDAFLRLNFARPDAPVLIYGPAGTVRAIHHRLLGVTWNLISGQPGEFLVTDVESDRMVTARLRTSEAFEHAHLAGEAPFQGSVHEAEGIRVEARIMEHGIPCLAYLARETPRLNVDKAAMVALGLAPGRWIQHLKDPGRSDEERIEINGATRQLGELRRRLLASTPGASVAYLTDFSLDERSTVELEEMIRGCDVIVGEASYRDAEAGLARRHRHFTGSEMGRLAARAGARRLVLFHLSDRYTREQWRELLEEVRGAFPASSFPAHWDLA